MFQASNAELLYIQTSNKGSNTSGIQLHISLIKGRLKVVLILSKIGDLSSIANVNFKITHISYVN